MQKKFIGGSLPKSFLFDEIGPRPATVFWMVCIAMLCGGLGGVIEFWYLTATGQATLVEYIALAAVQLTFLAVVITILLKFRGFRAAPHLMERAVQRMALVMFFVALIYVAIMVISAFLFGGLPERAFHSALWILPALIAMTLTQKLTNAWRLALMTIVAMAVLPLFLMVKLGAGFGQDITVVSFVQLFLAVCASTALLYVLAALREERGAGRAELALMEETQQELRRSAELAKEAQAAAEQMNRSMTAFLNNISHELRTPLNGIIGFAEIIRDEMFGAHTSPQYRDYAGDIAGSGAHLLGLVNDLLFFSQLNAGRVTIKAAPFDIGKLLNDTVDSYATQAHEAGLTIRMDKAAAPGCWVNLDAVLIRQVLCNLISNGIKFSHAGGVITLGYRMLPQSRCEIWVSDTGIGISESERETILQLFRQGPDSDQNAVPGTGLGLAMVKMLVDMQDGVVDFETNGKCGTTVRITLPISVENSASEMQSLSARG